jgi:hypothetical protein
VQSRRPLSQVVPFSQLNALGKQAVSTGRRAVHVPPAMAESQ